MAQTFPLPVTFFAGLRPQVSTLHLPSALHDSRTRGGAITTARLAERLWTARMTLTALRHREAASIEAQLSALSEPGRSLFVQAVPRLGPAHDPSGVLLAGGTTLLDTISADRRELRISGLPAQFVLTAGDCLSFAYGTDPVRYAFHRVVVGAVASLGGLTPLVEVTPPIRLGATTGATIELLAPFFKAVLIPGAPARSRALVTDGLTLDLVQTLR